MGPCRASVLLALVAWGALVACERRNDPSLPMTNRFASDVAFLREHTTPILLGPTGGAQVVVAPEYQGRGLTSTTGGSDAASFGWIGRAAIAARARQPHMNVFGGEDRFWLGPEGGQFALYFKKGDPFDLIIVQVPKASTGAPGESLSVAQRARFRNAVAAQLLGYTLRESRSPHGRLLDGPEVATQTRR